VPASLSTLSAVVRQSKPIGWAIGPPWALPSDPQGQAGLNMVFTNALQELGWTEGRNSSSKVEGNRIEIASIG
jgi:hypothetical protein